VQGVTLVYALGVIVVILITDLVTARLDPRIRSSERGDHTSVALIEPSTKSLAGPPSSRERSTTGPSWRAPS